jgi:hypothetical protein
MRRRRTVAREPAWLSAKPHAAGLHLPREHVEKKRERLAPAFGNARLLLLLAFFFLILLSSNEGE